MPIVADVLSPTEFDSWVADQQAMQSASADDVNRVPSMDELMPRLHEVYAHAFPKLQ